jgi:hypothetical protein
MIVTLIALFVTIIQLPLLLLMIPVIVSVFSYAGTAPAIIFAIWAIIWSISDNSMMGRGVDIPMLVILLRAIRRNDDGRHYWFVYRCCSSGICL